MNRIIYFAIFVGLATTCDAQVMAALPKSPSSTATAGGTEPAFLHGEYWVAGRPGARYAIEIRNRLGERLLAVTSVDGVNVVSGATAGWDQAAMCSVPAERIKSPVGGRRTRKVAAFTFVDSPNSYAERTGRPANVGVIGVAIFRERQPQPVYAPPMIGQSTGQAAERRSSASDSALPVNPWQKRRRRERQTRRQRPKLKRRARRRRQCHRPARTKTRHGSR